MAYWLSTTSTLLFLIQKSLSPAGHKSPRPSLFGRMTQGFNKSSNDLVRHVEAKYPALLFKQQLTAYVEKIFAIIRNNLKKDLSSLLSYCIQAARTSKDNPPPPTHWGIVIQCLNGTLTILKENHVPPVLVQKIITEAFSNINVQIFNSLLLHQECCTFRNGEYVKAGLVEIEQWCGRTTNEVIQQKSKIGYDELTTKLYAHVPFSTDEIDHCFNEKDFADVKPSGQLLENPAFHFLLE
ncbi:hypothetical protein L1987_10624 [Smallanthus sonchifolius]|uniref:Uncharacterized protein n=1 Tax=Smallanthus sonchifolius TaxID=185202 RepID=A0ACB9JSK5_9ASTR|nr:hypothetical protein L1987_10624 [Smallanthus sonchifolius]